MSSMNHGRRDSKSKNESNIKEDKFINEDRYLKSYNQELKETMNSFRGSHVVSQDNKLFYQFETNNNTSISSTTGQIEVEIILLIIRKCF